MNITDTDDRERRRTLNINLSLLTYDVEKTKLNKQIEQLNITTPQMFCLPPTPFLMLRKTTKKHW